jgi:hypothetical protein
METLIEDLEILSLTCSGTSQKALDKAITILRIEDRFNVSISAEIKDYGVNYER